MQKLSHSGDQEIFRVAPEGETPKKIGSSFYRGENCNFNPYGGDHNASDFVQRFFLKGWSPQERFISPQTQITAFGSCFAHHIGEHLAKLGFDTAKRRASDIYVSKMGEGLVNVHSILQQFKWALEDWKPPSNLWHDYDAEEFDLKEDIRQKTRSVFLSTDVFILTFGLSEIWYDEVTGGVFWRAVPLKHFDPERHKFRVCTFEETKDCLSEIIRLIRTYVPNAKVVMTVSPIPLIATFRPVACITANSVSKAIIRAALDEVVRVHPDSGRELFYFPRLRHGHGGISESLRRGWPTPSPDDRAVDHAGLRGALLPDRDDDRGGRGGVLGRAAGQCRDPRPARVFQPRAIRRRSSSAVATVVDRRASQAAETELTRGLSEAIGKGPNLVRQVLERLAGATGLEPATSGVTGRRSNRLSYTPAPHGESAHIMRVRTLRQGRTPHRRGPIRRVFGPAARPAGRAWPVPSRPCLAKRHICSTSKG